jgi:ABC-type Fe3+ transport system permease subunit
MSAPPRAPADRRAAAFRVARWTVPLVGAVLLAFGGVWAVDTSQSAGTRRWLNADSALLYGALLAAYATVTWAARGLRRPGRGRGARVLSSAVETVIVGLGAAPAVAFVVLLVAWFAEGRP